MQNPKVVIQSSTKSLLDSKKHDGQTYNDVIQSLLSQKQNEMYSALPKNRVGKSVDSKLSEIVGASAGDQAFNTYTKTLNWIKDTRRKLPGDEEDTTTSGITPEQREEAFNKDPLVSGIITPFLKNILLGSYNIVTGDNKKFAQMVTDVEKFMKQILYMETARVDFENYAIKHGKSYWRKDYDDNDNLKRLQILDAKSIITHIDTWDSSIKAHHQRIWVNDVWDSNESTNTVESNSWFIPEGELIIESDNIGDDSAWELWKKYQKKYNISETAGLRVSATESIIDMHKNSIGAPAPIDSAILAIWLKRLVIANSPNVIFNTLVPFMHVKMGMVMESIDSVSGQKTLITSVPQKPPSAMATTDPELYAQLLSNYNGYESAKTDAIKNLMRYRAENGAFATGPDVNLDIKQSASSITSSFIETMIRQLNEDIGMALGFPVSLVLAKGAELATSRSIKDLFNTVYSGSKQDYERIALELIEERFTDETWKFELKDKEGNIESGTYTLEDTALEFKLGEQDKKDALIQAQTELVTLQTAQIAKAIGASANDIKAYLDENEMGIWDLDNYDFAINMLEQQGNNQSDIPELKQDLPGIPGLEKMAGLDAPDLKVSKPSTPAKPTLPSDVRKESVMEMIESTIKPDINQDLKQKQEEDKLKDDLLFAFQTAEKAMLEALEK